MFPCFTFSLLLIILSLLPTTISSLPPSIGVNLHSAPPSPNLLPSALHSLNINSLLLRNPDPLTIRPFLYSNVSLLLTIPNSLVPSLATNRSSAIHWLYHHLLPFHPRITFPSISVGNDFPLNSPNALNLLFPAIRNLHLSLLQLGIHNVTVSTSFSFASVITNSFPPSAARFQDFAGVDLISPLLQFLRNTNSSFFINLYPYNMYRLNSAIPIGFALFREFPFNFRDDFTAGVRYQNLFDMMIDAVVSAMAAAGYENIPIVVTETGWPISDDVAGNEEDAYRGYAEMYLKGLVNHLKSGKGTPMRKEGVACVYLYELFDEGNEGTQEIGGRQWGILYSNLTSKYALQFSGSWSASIGEAKAWVMILLEVCFLFLAH